MVQPVANAAGLSRVEKRKLGMKFRNDSHEAETTVRSTSSSSSRKSNQQSLFSFCKSPALEKRSMDVRRFLSHSLAHATYDLYPEHWRAMCETIKTDMALSAQESLAFESHWRWLKSNYHCRFSDQFSDMTKDIVSRAKTMNCKADLVRFLSLLYLVVNHRKFVNSWQELSSVADEQEFHAKLIAIVGDEYIVNMNKYPVSTATGMRLGLEGSTQHEIIKKHLHIACINTKVLLARTESNQNFLADWTDIQKATQCSDMQAMMISRIFCDTTGNTCVKPENWTCWSRPYVPAGYDKHPCHILGERLQILAASLPIGRTVMEKAKEHGITLFSGRHVEHAGCELRKSVDGVGACRGYRV